MVIRFELDSAGITACSGGCGFSYDFGGTTTNITYTINSSNSFPWIFDNLVQGVGHGLASITLTPVTRSIEALSRKTEDFGRLSKAREIFSSDGPLGAIGDVTCDVNLNMSTTVSFWEDGAQRTFEVSLQGKNVAGPHNVAKYICDSNDPKVTSCAAPNDYYDVVLYLRQLVGVEFRNHEIVKFDCTEKFGEYERQETETETGETEMKKELLFWNTEVADKQRYEYYSYNKIVQVTGSVLQEVRTVFERAEKVATDKVRLDFFSYDTKLKSGAYEQRAEQRYSVIDRASTPNHIASTRKSQSAHSSNGDGSLTPSYAHFSMFYDTAFSQFERSPNVIPAAKLAFSPNGNHIVKAVIAPNLNTSFASGTADADSISGSFGANPTFHISVNDSRKVVLCYLASPSEAYIKIFDGSVWKNYDLDDTNAALEPVVATGAKDIRCKMTNNDEVLVAVLGDNAGKAAFYFFGGLTTHTEAQAFAGNPVDLSANADPATAIMSAELIYSGTTLGVAAMATEFATTNMLHFQSLYWDIGGPALASSGLLSTSTGTPTVSDTFTGLEISNVDPLNDPRITVMWNDTAPVGPVLGIYNVTGGAALVHEGDITTTPPVAETTVFECLDAPFDLTQAPTTYAGCVPLAGSYAKPVKNFRMNINSLNPMTFNNFFTSSF